MKTTFPTLKTDELLLRQITDEDLESLYLGLSHPEVIRYYGISFRSKEATKEQLAFYRDLEENGTGLFWAICSPDNQAFLGTAGLYGWSKEHHKAEIGFWLLPEYWGKGFIKTSLPLVCRYGFEQLNLHRIEAFVESENQNSKKVLEKLGFNQEGTMKDCEVKNGKFISLEIYAKLAKSRVDILPFQEAFRPQLISLWEASVLATHHFLKPDDFLAIKKMVDKIDFNSLSVFCLVKNEKVLGFLGVDGKKIEMLFLSPEVFGKGLGKRLLDFATHELQADEVDVNEQNTQAVAFYKKMGFEIINKTDKDGQGKNYPLLNMKLR
ncbi:GNAT family N-acetyltransferase [Pararhodonellum marinum]|uniref:GNAT family N-acetyltransferase n=1 Tax=Pararhodonellum marinum TaxID=2755358 RepID=UPI001E474B19|nr:GNAT family N-acetyltransferase [Pararhodonellum marinum]